MVVKLIAKDKKEIFQFQGRCKLIIDSLSKLLLVQPFDEEFKMISAMFTLKSVAQKNILFVFAEFDFQDFALIFDNTAKCKKTFEFLVKKGATAGNLNLIRERFLLPLFNKISKNDEPSINLKEILKKWIENQEDEEKNEYIQLLRNNDISDMLFSSLQEEEDFNTRKRNNKNMKSHALKTPLSDDTPFRESSNTTSLPPLLKKRKYQDKLFSTNKLIEAPYYEILKYVFNGQSKTKLSIFPTSDRRYCYEYFWLKSKNYFVCYSCRKRKHVTAKVIKRNGKEIVQLNENQHICGIKKYKQIIEKSSFELIPYENQITQMNRLIIYLNSSREKCYEFAWHNTSKTYFCCGCGRKKQYTSAYLCQKEDGTEFVMIKSNQHICEPRKFNVEKYNEKEIVEASNFEIRDFIKDGVRRLKLFVFTSSDKTLCYVYYSLNATSIFRCHGCQNRCKNVAARLCRHDDGRKYLKLNTRKHICEQRQYNPEKYEMLKDIVENSNFKKFKYNHNGSEKFKLVVFCPTNMNLCYEYYKNLKSQSYMCSYCPRENQVTATLCQKEDANEYLILSKNHHMCNLIEFDPEKYKDDVIFDKEMYNIRTTITRNVTSKRLTIFTSDEKKYCYKFSYKSDKKHYHCSSCFSSKVYITATIQNEGKENEFLYVSNQKHVCEPLESSSLIHGNIIIAPNYQFVKRRANGKIMEHLAVFTNEEKTECYEYTWNKHTKHYACYACQRLHKIYVYAKILINGENKECIELGENIHRCDPIKFVPENIITKIVKQPDFKLYETTFRQKNVKRLVIFDSENKKYGRIYSYQECGNIYRCHRCRHKNKYVIAKVMQDENGQNYLELNQNEHLCESQKL